METPISYIAYLQHLLASHHIPFQSEADYLTSHSSTVPQNNQHKPLKTSLTQQLHSQLLLRYSRQMLLKEIKYQNQIKIIKSKVAVIGSGGIGCPVAMYLSGAGVGQIGLFDSDTVQISNLHRQIAHKNRNMNRKKTTSLKETLSEFNPHITIKEHQFITIETLHELDQYDLIIDGSDNPQCRYLLNDYVFSKSQKSKRLLSGACIGWEAQITCYSNDSESKTACYRCLWGNQQFPTGGCAAQGVIGMVPGLVGILLGVEALKILTAGKSSLQGSLLTYEGRTCTFRKMKLRTPLKECIGCGEDKLNISSYNYSKHSVCSTNPKELPEVPSITWEEYLEKFKSEEIMDVRSSSQYSIVRLENSINVPYEDLVQLPKEKLDVLTKERTNKPIFVSCKTGVMSRKATQFLIDNGLKAFNIKGGINQYGKKYDSEIPLL